jgi:hypothetical protein
LKFDAFVGFELVAPNVQQFMGADAVAGEKTVRLVGGSIAGITFVAD